MATDRARGPIAVRADLGDYLPGPVVAAETQPDGTTRYHWKSPAKSIGRVRTFYGNIGILLRGYCYLRTLGPDGVREAAEQAILNANYLRALLADILPTPHGDRCLHEFVASAKALADEKHISAMDIAKRLLDYGFHAPTVYFPLVVPEAMMMEPTETESKETLDAFSAAAHAIVKEDPEFLHQAPSQHRVSRPDDVTAALKPGAEMVREIQAAAENIATMSKLTLCTGCWSMICRVRTLGRRLMQSCWKNRRVGGFGDVSSGIAGARTDAVAGVLSTARGAGGRDNAANTFPGYAA
ncbi:MAG: hypothetical protein U0872_08310 [Planctomycetaceae bacterium]